MFVMLAKSARSILPWVGKKIFKAVAPILLDEGRQLLTRKKNVKQAVKSSQTAKVMLSMQVKKPLDKR